MPNAEREVRSGLSDNSVFLPTEEPIIGSSLVKTTEPPFLADGFQTDVARGSGLQAAPRRTHRTRGRKANTTPGPCVYVSI